MKLEITIDTDENGLPVFDGSIKQKLELLLARREESGQYMLEIAGKGPALLRLAEALITVAKTPDYHLHLGEGRDNSPVEFFPEDLAVTITNNERVKYPEKRTNPLPPPDWARG